MQLDKLAIHIKPRSSWQAFDLGCKFAVAHWQPLILFWLSVTLPLFILLNWVAPNFAILILWWFKPWFERGLHFILSRALFGEMPNLKQTLSAWPQQVKPLWFSSITWRRFSPSRGFDTPVTQLEGLSGDKRRRRLTVLHKSLDDNSSWWTLICAHWELFIVLGLAAFINLMVPEGLHLSVSWQSLIYSDGILRGYNTLYYIAISLIAPLYVAGSFVAYINRRVILEAWDLEVDFKKIRQRLFHSVISCFTAVILTIAIAPVDRVWAEPAIPAINEANADLQVNPNETEHSVRSVNEPILTTTSNSNLETDKADKPAELVALKQQLNNIYQGEVFKQTVQTEQLVWVGGEFDWEWLKSEDENKNNWLLNFFKWLSGFLEFGLWFSFIGLILALAFYFRQQIFSVFNFNKTTPTTAVELPSFVSTAETVNFNDDSVYARLTELMQQNNQRAVLSVLLQLCLQTLHTKYNAQFSSAMTEAECLAVAQPVAPTKMMHFFNGVIEEWICLAWAHQARQPDKMTELIEQAVELFNLTRIKL